MPRPAVFAYDESAQVAKAVGDFVVRAQAAALSTGSAFNVAVSGGSLIQVLRNGLINRSDVEWSKWNIYLADERIVPLDHADSNYGGLKKELLDHLNAETHGTPKVLTLDTSLPIDGPSASFAASYSHGLTTDLGPKPVLDVILLGCGPDGHTCSLFPGHKLLNESQKLVASIDDSPKPPPRRITITKPVLALAKKIAFVAEGAGKAPILKDVFEHPEKGLPSSQVNELAAAPVSWFVNTPAINGVNIKNSAL